MKTGRETSFEKTKKGSRISKRIPVNSYDFPALESWLEEESRLGNRLEELSNYQAYFREGEPEDPVYRLEPFKDLKKKENQEQLEIYEASGWKQVPSSNKLYNVFFKKRERDMVELYTDSITQSYTLKKLYHRMIREILLALLLVLVFFVSLFVFTKGRGIVFALTVGNLWIAGLLVIFLAVRQVIFIAETVILRRRIRNLESGIGEERPVDWKKHRGLRALENFARFGIFGVMAVYYIVILCSAESGPLNLERPQMSTVMLSEMVGDREFEYKERTPEYRMTNSMTYWTSPLAPKIHRIYQSGYVREEEISEKNNFKAVHLTAEQYSLLTEGLAKGLTKDLREQTEELKKPFEQPLEEREGKNTDFDEIQFYEGEGEDYFIARLGKKVLRVSYEGSLEPEDYLNLWADRLKAY